MRQYICLCSCQTRVCVKTHVSIWNLPICQTACLPNICGIWGSHPNDAIARSTLRSTLPAYRIFRHIQQHEFRQTRSLSLKGMDATDFAASPRICEDRSPVRGSKMLIMHRVFRNSTQKLVVRGANRNGLLSITLPQTETIGLFERMKRKRCQE